MPKIPIFRVHPFLICLVFFALVIMPVSASCDAYHYDYIIGTPPGCDYDIFNGYGPNIAYYQNDPENYETCGGYSLVYSGPYSQSDCTNGTPTPTPTPVPSDSCVSACGHTWASGFNADSVLLRSCIFLFPLDACEVCGWQMQLMEEQFPCVNPPSPVPTYVPTPLPTVPPPPTVLPTLPPRPSPGPQVITIGDTDIHDVDFAIPTIATLAIPSWNSTIERDNITSVVGNNISAPYLDNVDNFSIAVALTIQHLLYLPNWVVASIYSTVQPIAAAYVDIIVIVVDWGSVPLQLMRLALDNIPFGIHALLIYGVCLEMIIYLLRGET